MLSWFKTENTTGREYPTPDGVPQMEGGFSPSSGTDVNPELEALREEAAGYEPLGAGVGISDPGPRAESGAAFPVDDALIGKVWALVFDRVAVGAGSHWKLTDEEEKQIGLMTKPVLAKYMPAVMSSTARSFVCWQLPG